MTPFKQSLWFVLVSLSACSPFLGPRAMAPARFDYNQALSSSWDEQLLLNIVRLKYLDTATFLEVSSVLSQFELQGSLGTNLFGEDSSLNTGVAYKETPTISYTPLQGEEFVNRLLSQVTPSVLLMLSHAGWSIEMLMRCCVQRVGDVVNAPAATNPVVALSQAPRYQDFQRLCTILNSLKRSGHVEVLPGPTDSGVLIRFVAAAADSRASSELAEVRELLELPEDRVDFEFTTELGPRSRGSIPITTRSYHGIMVFLSNAVEAPAAHEGDGFVARTITEGGADVDWGKVTGNVLRVRSQLLEPLSAFVKVPYRGHWFYIADSDLHSKSTFGMLTYLFHLQSSTRARVAPIVTVPAGG